MHLLKSKPFEANGSLNDILMSGQRINLPDMTGLNSMALVSTLNFTRGIYLIETSNSEYMGIDSRLIIHAVSQLGGHVRQIEPVPGNEQNSVGALKVTMAKTEKRDFREPITLYRLGHFENTQLIGLRESNLLLLTTDFPNLDQSGICRKSVDDSRKFLADRGVVISQTSLVSTVHPLGGKLQTESVAFIVNTKN